YYNSHYLCVVGFCYIFNLSGSTDIYTLSLHDALPICGGMQTKLRASRLAARSGAHTVIVGGAIEQVLARLKAGERLGTLLAPERDRKSTRLNSSHVKISYAVFCLKKKRYQVIEYDSVQ